MRIWALVAAFACSLAQAAWEEQFAGLWFDPANPGWGVSVHQQGDHAIATLLAYRKDGRSQWYQADIKLPPWDPYILWGTVDIGGTLREGGTSRNAGTISLRFDEDFASFKYVIDGVTFPSGITRFMFAPAGLQGTYTGAHALSPYRGCPAMPAAQGMRVTASTDARNNVKLILQTDGMTCSAEGNYTYFDSTPSIFGRAQCAGLEGMSDAYFAADDIHVARDSIALNVSLRNGDGAGSCGYYGRVVATRTALMGNAQPPHDDVSGLWTTDSGWSIAAHLQGNTLFAAVLAADGSWYVAPDAAYESGQDGDFVTYGGNLWSVHWPATNRTYDVTPAGSLDFEVDAAGYSSASYGPDGITSRIARLTWPNDASIAGNYLGVRTNLMLPIPTSTWTRIAVSGDNGAVRITLADGDTVYCDVGGRLEWHGLAGKIVGSGGCVDVPGGTKLPFQADEVRITSQGMSMRYWLNGEIGSIAGIRQ